MTVKIRWQMLLMKPNTRRWVASHTTIAALGQGPAAIAMTTTVQLDVNGDPDPVLIINNHDTHHGINLGRGIAAYSNRHAW